MPIWGWLMIDLSMIDLSMIGLSMAGQCTPDSGTNMMSEGCYVR